MRKPHNTQPSEQDRSTSPNSRKIRPFQPLALCGSTTHPTALRGNRINIGYLSEKHA